MSNPTGIAFPDYLVILAYFAVIVGIGYYFARSIKQARDYFAAGNVMPWWLAGTSFYMVSFSALLFVIYNEITFQYGIVGIVICWTGPPAVLLGGFFTAHLWRRARVITPLGFMERRYSKTVHQVFVWTGFPLRMFDNALKIFSTAIVVTVALRSLGLSVVLFMVIIGIIMIAYSFMGGQMTVIIADFVQAAILGVAVVLLFAFTLSHVGHLGQFFHNLPDGFLSPVRKPYDWSYLIFTAFLITLLSYNASWALVQKYNTVRSEADARKMIYLIAFLMFVSPPIFFFPGLAARVLMPGLENAKEVFAVVAMKVLPLGMMGFIISAMLSATMSTLGSEFNTLSGILTRDFYKRKVRPDISESREVVLGRVFTVIIGSITIILAIVINSFQGFSLMDIMFRFFTAFGPPIMIPLVFGLLFKKFNSRGVIWGVIAGATTGVGLILANIILVQVYTEQMKKDPTLDFWLRSGWNSVTTVLNVMATILGMWLGSVTRKTSEEEKRQVDSFFDDLKKPFLLEAKAERKFSPFKIVGLALAAFGAAMALISVVVLFFYHKKGAFLTDLLVGVFFLLLGGGLRLWPGKNEVKPDPRGDGGGAK